MNEAFTPICNNLSVGDNGHLLFAGMDTAALAEQYGTPLYLMDEDRIRERCRSYLTTAKAAFQGRARVLYASKAASFKRICVIMKEEGLGLDVVSAGEILTAAAAGYPMEQACFHSNNKTDDDIELALSAGVGCFAVDNREELLALNRIAGEKGISARILLRVTPGIDPHTFEAVATGRIDSKFGFGLFAGQAGEAVALALTLPHITLAGFHCHVGSQIFDADVFLRTAETMLTFLADVRKTYGYEAGVLNLGGGFGVRYRADQKEADPAGMIAAVGAFVRDKAATLGIGMPEIWFEPGRSVVADAGLTLYTVGSVKTIPGYRSYVSVDGGMADNIRYALYQAPYTVLAAGKMDEPSDMICSLVGRCCESGDILQPDIKLPGSIARGDLIAVCTTGAYHYSMASHYNRLPCPPVVMLRGGTSYVAVRRETAKDLMRLDV